MGQKTKPNQLLPAITLIPLILVSALIFRFSAQTGEKSTEVSNGLTIRLLMLFTDLSEYTVDELKETVIRLRHKIRKTAHVLEYAAFGFFLALHLSTWIKKLPWLWGLAVSVIYGLSDELHQYFVGERVMQLRDVGFDLVGAALGIGAFLLLRFVFRRFRENRAARNTPG